MKRGTPDHPKLLDLADELQIPLYAAGGLLEFLWQWAARYAIQGDVGKRSNAAIARGIKWDRDPDLLVQSLINAGWVDEAPEPYRLVIHDVKDHADNTWKQNLDDAGLTWWDGAPARSGKSGKPKLVNDKPPVNLQQTSNKPPQPEPEPEPIKPLKPSSSISIEEPSDLAPNEPRYGKAWFDEQHELWYKAFWNHAGKQDSRRAFEKRVKALVAKSSKTHAEAVEFLTSVAQIDRERFEPSPDWEWRERMHPATWLNQERWTDEPKPTRRVNGKPQAIYTPPPQSRTMQSIREENEARRRSLQPC